MCEIPTGDLMTESEWKVVMDDLKEDDDLKVLTIEDYVDYPFCTKDYICGIEDYPGFRAVCFYDGKNSYVVFRGTHGEDEWKDNVEAMFQVESKYQIAASEYVRKIRNEIAKYPNEIVVAGHSKGGNKAQYSFLTTDANHCFSLDGQGFSKEFTEVYKEQIYIKAKRIVSCAERRDFVNCLGYYIQEPMFFKGRKGDTLGTQFPFGKPIWYFHSPDALRNRNDNFGSVARFASISKVINELCVYMLSKINNQNIAEDMDCMKSLILLITGHENLTEDEFVDSTSKVSVKIFEVAQKYPNFEKDIIQLVILEWRVIKATFDELAQKQSELSNQSIISLVEIKVAELLKERKSGLESLEHFINFIENQLIQKFTNYKYEILNSVQVLEWDEVPSIEALQLFFIMLI